MLPPQELIMELIHRQARSLSVQSSQVPREVEWTTLICSKLEPSECTKARTDALRTSLKD